MKALVSSLVLLLAAAAAEARSLHWSSIEVEARLDADGVLHVSERQAMVFDGDWNGGERRFGTRPGQKLRLERVWRIDDRTGEPVRLPRGSLDHVDEWDWESRHVLRWRARRPTDPPFDRTTIRYQIDYSLRGVVRDTASGGYLLDHDFAFAERPGPIEVFTLDLELDPVWTAAAKPGPLRLEDMPPGEGAVVVLELAHSGERLPRAADHSVPTHQALALGLALLSLVGLKLAFLWRAETGRGRRERAAVPTPITRGWLDEHLFSLRPEDAGALWDRKVGAPEVAAVVARMVSEGKLASRVTEPGRWWRKPTMELDLVVERGKLSGYERRLIDKLFFDGRTTTDTRALQTHYQSTGFDPATEIRAGIEAHLKRLDGDEDAPAKPSWKPTALVFLALVAMLVLEAVTRGPEALGPLAAALAIVGVIPVIWAYIGAVGYRNGVGRPPFAWLTFLPPLALLAGGCIFFGWSGSGGRELLADFRPGLFGMLALFLFALMVAVSVLNVAHTRERRGLVARRRLLAAARQHFRDQLAAAVPDLEDGWFPYILAFGLSRDADAWARSHGSAATGSRIGTTSWSGSAGPGTGWSGGGGAFGGAGATAAWTAAATGMAAGVSPPSSSGSGGGGGGGSSGGGGGGGW